MTRRVARSLRQLSSLFERVWNICVWNMVVWYRAAGVEMVSAQCYSTATNQQVPDSNCDRAKPSPMSRRCKQLHCRVALVLCCPIFLLYNRYLHCFFPRKYMTAFSNNCNKSCRISTMYGTWIDIKIFTYWHLLFAKCLKHRTSWGFPMAARTEASSQ